MSKLSWPPRSLISLLLILLVPAVFVSAQQAKGRPAALVAPEVNVPVHFDISPPLRDMATQPGSEGGGEVEREVRRPKMQELIAAAQQGKKPVADGALQTTAGPLVSASIGLNLLGVGNGFPGYAVPDAPSDVNLAVGDTQVVQWVNVSYAVFDKSTGAIVAGPVLGNAFWAGFGGPCQNSNSGDIIAQWDKIAHRWVISQNVFSSPYMTCIAISTTPDATGTYYRFAFSQPGFPDYPKWGLWPDAYYQSQNNFGASGTTYVGARACAYERAKLLVGNSTAKQICFQTGTFDDSLLPADLDSPTMLPPTGQAEVFVGSIDNGTPTIYQYLFHVDFTTPSNSTFTGAGGTMPIPGVSSFSLACGGFSACVPQPSPGELLDSLGDRLMYRLAYRNFSGNHQTWLVSHSVTAGSSVGERWYEFRAPETSTSLSVYQQGTFAPDSKYRWMGSIAMDGSQDIALGYSVSSSSVFPSISYTGRVPTDGLGTMESEASVVAGAGSQTSTQNRWGDYTSMAIDAADDCTFWYTNEYYQVTASFKWSTRIASFKFANCGSSVTISPTSLTFGNQVVNTTSSSQTVTLTNNGTASVTSISVGTSGDFGQTNNCGTSLAANSSCTINVAFTPTATGTRTGTLTVTDSAGTQSVGLSGTGTAAVSLTPSSVSFGNQGVGTTSSAHAVTLASGGTSSLTGIGVSIVGTNASDFAQTNNCGTSVAGNSSCSINVTFTPSAYGARTATLSVTDSAGTQTSSLSGTGADVTAPTTQITAPANGAKVSGTVTVTATASDNVGVTSIQIYIDGTLKSSGTTSPLNYSWNTSTVANGTHTIYSKASDAAGNVGTSSTITLTVSNGNTQLIQNGGFEKGNLTGWSATGVYLPFVQSGHHREGAYAAQLGATSGTEPNGNSSLYQTITIPSTATTATFQFWYMPFTTDTIANDWQEVQIQNSSGATLAQLVKVSSNSQIWTHVVYNAIAFKGQTIRVYFNVHGNGNGRLTYMYLDDVNLGVR